MATWHEETKETVHDEIVRKLENYYEQLKGSSWMQQPKDEKYEITEDCDLECSEECLELTEFEVDLKILDSCNAERCNCYYS